MGVTGLEFFDWSGQGYQPLVFSQGWQVALLNWEPIFDLENLGEIERHKLTDEVFVLIQGQAVLFTLAENGLQAVDMQPGVVYNVTVGSWHNLIATRNARWIIVENRDTHLHDTELRQLNAIEMENLRTLLPDWL
jgi:hypothetical protein